MPDQIPDVHCAKIAAAVNVVQMGYFQDPLGNGIPSELFDLRKKAVAYLNAQFTMADTGGIIGSSKHTE